MLINPGWPGNKAMCAAERYVACLLCVHHHLPPTHTAHRILTQDPHIAGSETNIELAYFVAKQWRDLGFDKVELLNYTVLLQYPNNTNPNKFRLLDGSGKVFYDAPTAQLEPPLTADEKKPGVARPFNAYSGVGNARVRTAAYYYFKSLA